MVKLKNKLLLALSAVAVGATLAGVGLFGLNSAWAFADDKDEEEKAVYAITDIFTPISNSYMTSGKYNGTYYAGMGFGWWSSSICYKKDLAYKWMNAKGDEEYFSLEFAFGDLNFTTFSLTFKANENSTTASGTTVNTITFTNNSGTVKAKVNDEAEVFIDVSSTVKISLAAPSDSLSGKYDVIINGINAGQFENVAGSYASASTTPITFSCYNNGEWNQVLYILEMNGQTFDLDNDGLITDNASPVLVVNQDVKFFSIGSAFTLDYSVVDVLAPYPTNTIQYSQYEKGKAVTYNTLTTSSSFAKTSTYDEYGEEYVSVKFILTDKDTTHSNEVMLSWYADSSCLTSINGVDYISVGVDEEGPEYECITRDDEKRTSVLDDENEAYLAYIDAVEEASEDLESGSGKYFYLPSLEDLISDGQSSYSEFTFNIYYKKSGSSSTMSRTSLAYNKLSIETVTSGTYTFRVTASDASGNPMQVYRNGRLVDVTSDNIWDFECIPEFSFKAYNIGITVDAAKAEETGTVGEEYTFTDFKITAEDTTYSSAYSLWYFSGAYGSVSYTDLINIANTQNGYEGYIGTSGSLSLVRIAAFNSGIDQANDPTGWAASDNDYKWDEATKTFTPQKPGFYILRVVLTDNQTDGGKIIAYKVVSIGAAAVTPDTNTDTEETTSLKDKLISIALILVVIAAVVVLIVLYTRKPKTSPSDEADKNDKTDGDTKN